MKVEIMYKTMRKTTISIMLLLLIVITACHRDEMPSILTGDCFIMSINNKQIVVRIDGICNNNVLGSVFHTDSLFAEPKSFTFAIASNGKGGTLDAKGIVNPVDVKWKAQGNQLICRCKSAELPRKIVLEKCVTIDTLLFHRQLCDSLYDVKVTTNVEYARADGYWTSYPDEDKSFADIYMQRLVEMTEMREQLLLMDIYEPVGDSALLRPLVLMIHGGAFYNGDKQDEAYVKWCRHFASLGYVAVSLNYRMGFLPYKNAIDCAGYRAVQDANASLRFLVHHADIYRINPDLIFTWGTSAGAITALNVAFLKDKNRPKSVVNEGKIAKLVPELADNFHVKAVANMWGAVHDTAILANSRTAVISFHGDADGIVPYDYGLPFKNMMSTFLSYQLEDQLSRLLSPSSDEWGSLQEVGFTMIRSGTEQWRERVMQPIWDKIVSPIYGSACIHEYLSRHGIRNQLFTVPGEGHSLHVDDHRRLVPYFYTIQDSVAQFFYTEIVSNPIHPKQERVGSQWFHINGKDVAEVHWQAEGGAVLEVQNDRARVVFFRDAPRHILRVSGRYKNGVEFSETLTVCL